MIDFATPTVGLAFFAGLASFLSPCVFALVPAYVGYLSGRSLGSDEKASSWVTFSHGIAFVLGFSIVFILIGILASYLGAALSDITQVLVRIGGVVVVIFGLHMLGVINIKFLNYDVRPEFSADRKRGYFSSALMGVFFSAGWAPCVGPVLGAILTFSFNQGSPLVGATLLTAYSAGLGIPFLIAATQISWVTLILRKYGKVMLYAERTMGVILIILGVLLFSGQFESFLAPLTGTAFFDLQATSELQVGRLLLIGAAFAAFSGLFLGWLGKRRGKNFVDWWFMGAGISMVLIVILFALGVFEFLTPFVA